ncbi:MAG: hypothetical protein NXI23_21325 [Bacteroidetes bacterium]|jgi:cell division protein FtsW (lipid II flippase)|nr:hypothetical protein [Bacteroidota bacterium]MDF1864742.1 hypothetical protein [Saprospiraceae bacterium]
MKPFELSLGTLLLRFYLMMGVVILAGFSGQWWIAIFALPILISAMAGISLEKDKKDGKVIAIKKMESVKEQKREVI